MRRRVVRLNKIRCVTQEHGLGCGVACVADLLGITYVEALKLFKRPQNAWTRGFCCRELVEALENAGVQSEFKTIRNRSDKLLRAPGTIVFTQFSKANPYGHYLIRVPGGWMNPWVNFPIIAPAKSGIVRRLPARASYAVKLREAPDFIK